jgi:hypothetical protein
MVLEGKDKGVLAKFKISNDKHTILKKNIHSKLSNLEFRKIQIKVFFNKDVLKKLINIPFLFVVKARKHKL